MFPRIGSDLFGGASEQDDFSKQYKTYKGSMVL